MIFDVYMTLGPVELNHLDVHFWQLETLINPFMDMMN
jgi:hypothetical protein